MATLKEQIREAARVAEEMSAPDEFNAMSWLDLLVEDNPESFDSLFDRKWGTHYCPTQPYLIPDFAFKSEFLSLHFTDISMPQLNGIEAARQIKKNRSKY